MKLQNTLFVALGLVLLAGLGWALLSDAGDAGPVSVTWGEADEEPLADGEIPPDALQSEVLGMDSGRVELQDPAVIAAPPPAPRPATVSGRVVDPFERPLAGATVVLEIGRARPGRRGGPAGRSRIRKPIETGEDGRFEFRGEAPPGASVSLVVTHRQYAASVVDHRFEQESAQLDVGDVRMRAGGVLLGSVTDADGIGIPGATARIAPQRGNRLMWLRNRDELLRPVPTDRNGFFRFDRLPPGDYRIDASAPRHVRASSDVVTVGDLDEERLDPIVLGPGHRLAGVVLGPDGAALAGADVALSPARGRGERRRTDAAGRFEFDHLTAAPVDLQVRAQGCVTHRQGPILPAEAPPLTIRLQRGLAIRGVVVDGRTGSPVTSYAARARRVAGLPGADGGGDLERARQDLQRIAEMTARLAEAQRRSQSSGAAAEAEAHARRLQALEQRSQFAARRLAELERERRRGGPGSRGRGRPETEPVGEVVERPGGAFEFSGLDEGVYVVDIGSPDHQRARTDPVELRVGLAGPHLTVRVQRGLHVSGTVLRSRDGRPIDDARVELVAPEEEREAQRPPDRGFLALFPRRARGTPVLSARTDGEGRFELRNAPAGRYHVVARAPGHAERASEAFELRADRGGVTIELGALARLQGTVTGVPADRRDDVRVMAFGGPGNMRNARAGTDGTYELEDLPPGGYVVRAFAGSMRSYLARELRNLLGAPPGSLQFDVVLEEGEERELDLQVSIPPIGEVAGSIVHNGAPGKGLRVALREVDPAGAAGVAGDQGMRWRFLDGGFRNQTRTNQDGEFAFRDVPEGAYHLTVQSMRTRGPDLHRREIYVRRDSRNEQRLTLVTTELTGEVRTGDGTPAAELEGVLRLYEGVRERPADPRAWASDHRLYTVRVQGGRFESAEVVSGEYLLELMLPGRERFEQPVSLGAGTVSLSLVAGPATGPKPSKQ